ncbi:MAG: thioredoxin [Deltaproteobacteria bacterium]|nr:thioredoxin [Deltaproteobacteria bacterium]
MSSDKVIHLNEDTFDKGIADGFTLVDFWAEWCAPCLALGPTIDEIADKYAGKVRVAKVNIDHNPGIPTRYGIRGIPTLIMFKDGQQADMFVGNSPGKVKEMVERAV